MSARRYITVVQDARGYPVPAFPPVLPEGTEPLMLWTCVKEEDYLAVEAERDRYCQALVQALGLIETASSRVRILRARAVIRAALTDEDAA